MFVKVCGLTSFRQVEYAKHLGYDMIGVVVHKESCRYVDKSGAEELAAFARKKHIKSAVVGVNFSEVADSAEYFDYIQIYEPTVTSYPTIFATSEEPDSGIPYELLLYDLSKGDGTFATFKDWVHKYQGKIILAGGLNPGNIEGVLNYYRPFGVDVSSGVENTKGIKDFQKMALFIKKIRECTFT